MKTLKKDIENLEKVLSFKFDNYYHNFLISYKNTNSAFYLIDITNLNGYQDTYEFYKFTQVLGNKDDELILDYTKRYQNEKRILNYFIVVGITSCGSLILINTKNNKIYFWDRDFEVSTGEEPTEENCYLIANDFQDFFENVLYEDE